MTDFIDYTEIKGETWFNAEDVLLCLGYMKDKCGKFNVYGIIKPTVIVVPCLICNHVNSKTVTLVNATTLLRVKEYLNTSVTLKKKVSNWSYMEKVRKDSMSSVLKLVDKVEQVANNVPENKIEPQVFTLKDIQPNDTLDYVAIYKNTGSCKAFWKHLRKLGVEIGSHKKGISWKTFKELRPDIYKEIEPHFTTTIKQL